MTAVCRAERPDVAFNLATKALLYSFLNPVGAFGSTSRSPRRWPSCMRTGALPKLVHLSSSEVYGTAQQISMGEDHPLLAETSYAAGKAAADLLLMSYVNMYDLDIVTVRPFNNYGPRQNDGAFAAIVPLTIRRSAGGRGSGHRGRRAPDARLHLRAGHGRRDPRAGRHGRRVGRTVNVGSGEETAIRAVVETLCEIAGYTGEIVTAPARPADVRRHRADISRAEELLGTVWRTGLRAGLERTYDWHRAALAA